MSDAIRVLATGITENKFNQTKKQIATDINYEVL
jgi:hypothetical protein